MFHLLLAQTVINDVPIFFYKNVLLTCFYFYCTDNNQQNNNNDNYNKKHFNFNEYFVKYDMDIE